VSSNLVEALIDNPARIKKVLFPSSSETVIDDEVLLTISEGFEHIDQMLAKHAFIRDGGTKLGDIDVGNGPARGFRSDEIRKLAARLTLVSVDDLRELLRTTPPPPPAPAPSMDEIAGSYAMLREFVIETARAEAGLIIYLG
jgi:hypothetical protein